MSGPAARSVESAGGLYAGGGVKPPPALSQAVIGMRAGGKRSVLVPAELGYGSRGEQEIPPNCEQFELQVRGGPGWGGGAGRFAAGWDWRVCVAGLEANVLTLVVIASFPPAD